MEESRERSPWTCFARLYACLAGALLRWDGPAGERIIRRAVEGYGQERGERLRQSQQEQGAAIHLQNLFAAGGSCGSSGWLRGVCLRDTRQVQRLEVLECPLAGLWAELGCGYGGSLYCEEYAHALLRGYTGRVGQANVSNALTYPRDDRCVLSYYYRPANMAPEQYEAFQTGGEAAWDWDGEQAMLCLGRAFGAAAQGREPGASAALAEGLEAFVRDGEEAGPGAAVAEQLRAVLGRKE